MITVADLRQKAERRYLDVLRAIVRTEMPFPMLMRVDKRLSANLTERRRELADLLAHTRERRGFGYELQYQRVVTRRQGEQDEIASIQFTTELDYLRFIGKEAEADQFRQDVVLIVENFPALQAWCEDNLAKVIKNHRLWPDLLAICRFFRDDYEPNRYYVRQLPLPVHTKFLEERSSLLISLLTVIKPALLQPVETTISKQDWRKRLGLLVPEPMIRTRALDDALRLDGKHDDFGLPLSAFARHIQPARRIVICENLLNFLTFPQMPNAVTIWSGGGFQIECLADVAWLREKQILYWGDLDAHGFQILNQCRKYFPKTQAILMEQATFEAHAHLVSEGEETKASQLPHLTTEELALFNLLKQNNWRVEQERLNREWVKEKLRSKFFRQNIQM